MSSGWDIRRIYLYLVCFATLMMLIVGTVQVIQGVTELIYPEPAYVNEIPPEKMTPNQTAEFKKYQAEQSKIEVKRQHVQRVRGVFTSFALLAVALPVYLYHWKKIQQTEA